ncbi:hypothetical protein Despr_1387 [Desulfobulbus propionicus DSM 2032]|uniref:PsbP C-terminal domain-containing protein n=1 Tax=Desulfobulbus propionicus (strain ATCC 33891 / DSM 2032 / VKM B-1956 / 1pr3) TaxID=577650 RepID=A0A7U3YLG7_DESPD|nr:hypothetical protein [Desulfobulbus propionicus]ADW17550.1 hypothetical protein Despr_1387 [Desulfobulbus propionicus DSM 2032]
MTTALKYLTFALMACCALAPAASGAKKLKTYGNQEFGFSCNYPASWAIGPSSVPNVRVKVAAPAKGPNAECTVIVKRYPNAANAQQSDIDQIFIEPPTPAELEEVLGQGGGVVKVVKASAGKLDVRPAHLARFQYRTSGNTYISGQVVMTATPGLTWSVSCGGQGPDPATAEKNFQHWESTINDFLASFRFK